MKLYVGVLVVCCTFFLTGTVQAEMYKWVDKNGVVHFSDTPVLNKDDTTDVQVIASSPSGSGNSGSSPSSPSSYGISDTWFDDDQLNERILATAKAFLKEHENWPEDPVFMTTPYLKAGQWTASYVLQTKIPAVMLENSDCTSGYQLVKVSGETNQENRRQCRLTGVELYRRTLYPTGCSLKR